jgi:hypothetical protein
LLGRLATLLWGLATLALVGYTNLVRKTDDHPGGERNILLLGGTRLVWRGSFVGASM